MHYICLALSFVSCDFKPIRKFDMKKLICFTLLINLYSFCVSQSKIDGIGIFKIGETKIKKINQILEDNKVELESYNNVKQTRWLKYQVNFVVAELFPNITDIDLNPLRTCFCPDVKVFFIKDYKIAGIYLVNIHLRFYKSTLIEFYCDSNEELLQALTTKYGDPIPMENWKRIWDKSKNDSISFSSLFWNNKPIYATITFESKSIKDNPSFIIRDVNYDAIIRDCEIQKKEQYLVIERKRLKENEDKKNKDLLDEL
jgi:hypothetical protein